MKIEGSIESGMIAQTISSVDDFTAKNGLSKMSRVQMNIVIEEILLADMEKLGADTVFSLKIIRKNGEIRAYLKIKGISFDPTNPGTPILNRVSASMSSDPVWNYIDGYSCVDAGIIGETKYDAPRGVSQSGI